MSTFVAPLSLTVALVTATLLLALGFHWDVGQRARYVVALAAQIAQHLHLAAAVQQADAQTARLHARARDAMRTAATRAHPRGERW